MMSLAVALTADTHAAPEKRNSKEFDWWSYHSRRGWEDNDYTGAR
jgi:hypothetical protein